MQDKADFSIAVIAVIGVVGAVLAFAIIVTLQAWLHTAEEQGIRLEAVVAAQEDLGQIVAAQQNQLNGYRVVDREKNVVAIPIDRAMDLIAREWASGTTRPVATHP